MQLAGVPTGNIRWARNNDPGIRLSTTNNKNRAISVATNDRSVRTKQDAEEPSSILALESALSRNDVWGTLYGLWSPYIVLEQNGWRTRKAVPVQGVPRRYGKVIMQIVLEVGAGLTSSAACTPWTMVDTH